jgi:hypothetical protein
MNRDAPPRVSELPFHLDRDSLYLVGVVDGEPAYFDAMTGRVSFGTFDEGTFTVTTTIREDVEMPSEQVAALQTYADKLELSTLGKHLFVADRLASSGSLSRRQAESLLVRRVLDRQSAAELLGIEPSTLDTYTQDAKAKTKSLLQYLPLLTDDGSEIAWLTMNGDYDQKADEILDDVPP